MMTIRRMALLASIAVLMVGFWSPRVMAAGPAVPGDITDPNALLIQFPPIAIDPEIKTLVVTPDQADDPTVNIATGFHASATAYSTSGMTTGLLEESILQYAPSFQGSGQWLASIFPDDASATAFENATVTGLLNAGLTEDPTFCGFGCHFFAVRIGGSTPAELGYTIFSAHNVVGEATVVSGGTIGQSANALTNFEASLVDLTSRGKTAIGYSWTHPMIDVGFLQLYRQVKGGVVPAAKLKRGQVGLLEIPVRTENLSGFAVKVKLVVQRGGKTYKYKMKKAGKAVDGATLYTYAFKDAGGKTQKATATVKISVSTQSAASLPLSFMLKG